MQPMYYIGLSQAEDQLLRERQQWQDPPRGIDFRHPSRSRPLDEKASTAMECGDGGDDVHGMDL